MFLSLFRTLALPLTLLAGGCDAVVLVSTGVDDFMGVPVVQFDAWGADSIRVRIAPPAASIQDPPYSPLLLPPTHSSGASSRASLTQGNLRISVDAVGCITATRVSDGVGLFTTTAVVFGAPAAGSSAGAVSASITLIPGAGVDRLLGMGEHREWQTLDVTGLNVSTSGIGSQFNTNSLIPFYMAYPVGWGFLWSLPGYGEYSLQAGAHTWGALATHTIDFWITTTPAVSAPAAADPATTSPLAPLLANLAEAVGHAAPMPDYVAGFWQCKNRYRNQSQLLEVARGYASRKLPLDIITIDYMHWPSSFGDWSFNSACWPDPQGMVDELRSLGVELAVTFWAHATPAGSHFAAFNASGFFATNLSGSPWAVSHWAGEMFLTVHFPEAARAAIFSAFRDGYGKFGVRTVWLDGSEPERDGITYGALRYPGAGRSDNEVGMAWVQQHLRAFAEGFTADGRAPNEFFLLPRSTWAGGSRYSAGIWSGDIASTFAELTRQVVIAQAMGLSGIALFTNDGGGYSGGDPFSPSFQELIVRWLQASAFFPIFRLHGARAGGPPADACGNTGGDNELWNLAKDDAHYNALAALLHLRRAMVPYTLAINAITVSTGMPMVRAMLLAFPGDTGVARSGNATDTQWMYGPDFLVAPVLAAGAGTWGVYLPRLPAEVVWVYHWNNTVVGQGGAWASVDTAEIENFPLFRRQPPLLWASS